jgi:hypothetical protein
LSDWFSTRKRGLRGHQDDGGVRVLLARRGEHLEPAHARHAHIGEHDVGGQGRDLVEPLLAAQSHVRREALVLEEDPQRLDDPRLVIDDQDAGAAVGALGHR